MALDDKTYEAVSKIDNQCTKVIVTAGLLWLDYQIAKEKAEERAVEIAAMFVAGILAIIVAMTLVMWATGHVVFKDGKFRWPEESSAVIQGTPDHAQ